MYPYVTYTYTHTHIHTQEFTHIHIHIYTYTYTCTHEYAYTYTCTYMCISAHTVINKTIRASGRHAYAESIYEDGQQESESEHDSETEHKSTQTNPQSVTYFTSAVYDKYGNKMQWPARFRDEDLRACECHFSAADKTSTSADGSLDNGVATGVGLGDEGGIYGEIMVLSRSMERMFGSKPVHKSSSGVYDTSYSNNNSNATYRTLLLVFAPREFMRNMTGKASGASESGQIMTDITRAKACARTEDAATAMQMLEAILEQFSSQEYIKDEFEMLAGMLEACAVIGTPAMPLGSKILSVLKRKLITSHSGWGIKKRIWDAVHALCMAVGLDDLKVYLNELASEIPSDVFNEHSLSFLTSDFMLEGAPELTQTLMRRVSEGDPSTWELHSLMTNIIPMILSDARLFKYASILTDKLRQPRPPGEQSGLIRCLMRAGLGLAYSKQTLASTQCGHKEEINHSRMQVYRTLVGSLVDRTSLEEILWVPDPGLDQPEEDNIREAHDDEMLALSCCVLACKDSDMTSSFIKRVMCIKTLRISSSTLRNFMWLLTSYKDHGSVLPSVLDVHKQAIHKLMTRTRGTRVLPGQQVVSLARAMQVGRHEKPPAAAGGETGKLMDDAYTKYDTAEGEEVLARCLVSVIACALSVSPPVLSCHNTLCLVEVLCALKIASPAGISLINDLSNLACESFQDRALRRTDGSHYQPLYGREQCEQMLPRISIPSEAHMAVTTLMQISAFSKRHGATLIDTCLQTPVSLIDTCLLKWATLGGHLLSVLLFQMDYAMPALTSTAVTNKDYDTTVHGSSTLEFSSGGSDSDEYDYYGRTHRGSFQYAHVCKHKSVYERGSQSRSRDSMRRTSVTYRTSFAKTKLISKSLVLKYTQACMSRLVEGLDTDKLHEVPWDVMLNLTKLLVDRNTCIPEAERVLTAIAQGWQKHDSDMRFRLCGAVFECCDVDTLRQSDCHALRALTAEYVAMLTEQLSECVCLPRTDFSFPAENYSTDAAVQNFFIGPEREYVIEFQRETQVRALLKKSIKWGKMYKHDIAVVWEARVSNNTGRTRTLHLTKVFSTKNDHALRQNQEKQRQLSRILEVFPGVNLTAATTSTRTHTVSATKDKEGQNQILQNDDAQKNVKSEADEGRGCHDHDHHRQEEMMRSGRGRTTTTSKRRSLGADMDRQTSKKPKRK
jgi:hypothetical protein